MRRGAQDALRQDRAWRAWLLGRRLLTLKKPMLSERARRWARTSSGTAQLLTQILDGDLVALSDLVLTALVSTGQAPCPLVWSAGHGAQKAAAAVDTRIAQSIPTTALTTRASRRSGC